jgi:hypothetical protein
MVEQIFCTVEGADIFIIRMETSYKNAVAENGAVLRIQLTQAQYAEVDQSNEMAKDLLRKYRFCAMRKRGSFYAVHMVPGPQGKKSRSKLFLHRLLMADAPVMHAKDGNYLNCRLANLEAVVPGIYHNVARKRIIARVPKPGGGGYKYKQFKTTHFEMPQDNIVRVPSDVEKVKQEALKYVKEGGVVQRWRWFYPFL